MATVECGRCPICGEAAFVTVDAELAERIVEWDLRGRVMFIQRAFPNLSADDRETILTGTHGACWDRAFDE